MGAERLLSPPAGRSRPASAALSSASSSICGQRGVTGPGAAEWAGRSGGVRAPPPSAPGSSGSASRPPPSIRAGWAPPFGGSLRAPSMWCPESSPGPEAACASKPTAGGATCSAMCVSVGAVTSRSAGRSGWESGPENHSAPPRPPGGSSARGPVLNQPSLCRTGLPPSPVMEGLGGSGVNGSSFASLTRYSPVENVSLRAANWSRRRTASSNRSPGIRVSAVVAAVRTRTVAIPSACSSRFEVTSTTCIRP